MAGDKDFHDGEDSLADNQDDTQVDSGDISEHDLAGDDSGGDTLGESDWDDFVPDDDYSPEDSGDTDSVLWDDSLSDDPEDIEDTIGDPDNVARSDEDVFGNDHSIPTYSGDSDDTDFTPFSVDDMDSDVPEGSQRVRNPGFSGWMKALLGVAVLLALILATWGALSLNTGEANPVEAWNKSFKTTTTVTERAQQDNNNIEEDKKDDQPGNTGNTGDEQRIKDLESSLTQALDDVDRANEDNEKLQKSIDRGATDTKTVTRSGSNRTVTNTQTRTKTSTRTIHNTRTTTRTLTSRAPAPRPETVTRTQTARVPGPERTVTRTVPTGRVTVTTTVIERWG